MEELVCEAVNRATRALVRRWHIVESPERLIPYGTYHEAVSLQIATNPRSLSVGASGTEASRA